MYPLSSTNKAQLAVLLLDMREDVRQRRKLDDLFLSQQPAAGHLKRRVHRRDRPGVVPERQSMRGDSNYVLLMVARCNTIRGASGHLFRG